MGLLGSVPGIPQVGKGYLKILCRVIAAVQILPNFFQRIQQSVQCVQCTASVIQNVCQIVQRLSCLLYTSGRKYIREHTGL